MGETTSPGRRARLREHARMSARATAVRWALAAMAGYALMAGLYLANAGGNPVWFILFGHESTVLPNGRQLLGPDFLVPHDQGQDGQTFWLQARDPLLLH